MMSSRNQWIWMETKIGNPTHKSVTSPFRAHNISSGTCTKLRITQSLLSRKPVISLSEISDKIHPMIYNIRISRLKNTQFSVSLTTNPIQPRNLLHNKYVTPWLRSLKDDYNRINSISYYGGTLKIQFVSDIFMKQYNVFLNSFNTDPSLKITDSSYKSTFIVSGLSPYIALEDRKAFEWKVGCEVVFFLKSLKTGKPIPRAVVKAPVHIREKLTTSSCSFMSMEVKFVKNKISLQDDFIFPRCNLCQK
ncbi:hypothetical protein ACOME3_010522 [Neoechinorhynchus agilis]